MKDSRRFGAARAEPDVILAVCDEAAAAGSERSLVGQGRGEALLRKLFPTGAAISGDDQLKLTLDGVAQGNTVFVVPEGDGIIESIGFGVLELKQPCLA